MGMNDLTAEVLEKVLAACAAGSVSDKCIIQYCPLQFAHCVLDDVAGYRTDFSPFYAQTYAPS